MEEQISNKLLSDLLEGPMNVEAIRSKFKIESEKEIKQLIRQIRRNGYTVREGELGWFIRTERLEPVVKPVRLDIDDIFGVWSDTHLCSKYCALNDMHEYMDYVVDRGIKQVFHAGDVGDGFGVYRYQESNLVAFGVHDQLEYLVDNFPRRNGVKHYVISGNHDDAVLKKTGANIVEMFANKREDVEYLGRGYARLVDQFNLKYDLVHVHANRAYSISYPLQVRQRNTSPEYRANATFAGHRHTMWYGLVNGERLLECGGFQRASPRYMGKGVTNDVAANIIEVDREENYLKGFKHEDRYYKGTLDALI